MSNPSKSRFSRKTMFRFWAISGGIFATFLLFIFAEGAVRIFLPQVNFQGTSRELYLYDEDGGPGWKPNAVGKSFGAICQIDELRCRYIGEAKDPETAWLLLGDSVVFGVGVDGEKTFAGLYQKENQHVKVLNSGACGAGPKQQLKVAQRLIGKTQPDIDRITLFFCLNDIGNLKFDDEALGVTDRVFHPENRSDYVRSVVRMVRDKSKLYTWAKGTFTNPPARYFRWELEKYRKWSPDPENPQTAGDIHALVELAGLAKSKDIPFRVVLMPYSDQYLSAESDAWLPQEKVAGFLEAQGVDVVDARSWIDTDRSKECFLFGDGCHLNELGHRLLFENISAVTAHANHRQFSLSETAE